MWITAYLLDRLNVMLTSNKWLVSPNSLFGNCCKILFSYYACLFYPFLFSSPYCVHWNNLKKQSRGYADNYVKEQFIRFLVSLIGCMFTKFQFSIVRGSKINQYIDKHTDWILYICYLYVFSFFLNIWSVMYEYKLQCFILELKDRSDLDDLFLHLIQ